jgi:PiT family inorganic phosphate transporter
VSGGFVAFTHGTNDAQKTMGVIGLALIVSGHQSADHFYVPVWVKVSAATAMALGTYAGGWRIIRTLGQRVAKLEPPQGFSAQTATAFLLWLTAHRGYPVSTTYVISGSVLGAGASTRLSAVRWGVAGNILVAWIITIPCAGLVAALMELITRLPGGVLYVFLLTAGIAGLAFSGRRIEARRLRLAAAPQAS